METSKPDWFNIERQSPEYVAQSNGREFIFTYHNTKVCIFGDGYTQFNHIFVTNPNQTYTYIFIGQDDGTQSVLDDLHAYGYPMIYEPWPCEQDVEAFIEAELQELDGN